MKIRHLSLLAILVALAGCNDSEQEFIMEDDFLISTVDVVGESYAVGRVYWAYDSDPYTYFELECEQALCDSWTFPIDVSGDVTVYAERAIPFENDEYCAEVYFGEESITVDSKDAFPLVISVSYLDSYCS